MIDIKIRYNTNCTDNHTFWRVIINGKEHTASDIIVEIPTYTTMGVVYDPVRKEMVDKHHLSCKANNIKWKGQVAIIT